MLLSIKQRNHVKDLNRIFAKQLRHMRRKYKRVRKRQAYKLQNPRQENYVKNIQNMEGDDAVSLDKGSLVRHGIS